MADDARKTAAPASFKVATDPAAIRQRIETLEKLLERSFEVPVVGKVGLDAMLGLLPVGGDVIAAILGLYIVWEARNLGVPKHKQVAMLGRVGFDALVGSVPVAGDVFDFVYRSNSKNIRTIRKHLDRVHPASATISG